jgi:flavin-dependent dehydrogenase
MTNPIHGGGIGPSMIAGKLAAEVGSRALESNSVCSEDLWDYNTEYMHAYGAKAASLDIFRIFLQKCTNEHLNYGLANRLIQEEDILKVSMGEELRLSIGETAQRVFRGIGHLSFLRALREVASEMNRIRALYRAYPQPRELSSWAADVDSVISKAKSMKL